MLALDSSLGYIREPFNIATIRPGICAMPLEHWYTHITPENESAFVDPMAKTLTFSYNIRAELAHVRSTRDLARAVRDYSRTERFRRQRRRPLLKDPIALFSAPWLARRFGVRVVVVIRHPAAFVSSLLRLRWIKDFRSFTAQPLLMSGLLAPFYDQIHAHVGQEEQDPLYNAALQWSMYHHVIDLYRQRYPGWHFVKHEDLSRSPIDHFSHLYNVLDLYFTPQSSQTILQSASPSNPSEAPDHVAHQLQRNSKANIWNWYHRLTSDQVNRVRSITRDVANRFYSENDWQPPAAFARSS